MNQSVKIKPQCYKQTSQHVRFVSGVCQAKDHNAQQFNFSTALEQALNAIENVRRPKS
ncbi:MULTISPECIES: hypothetical protein [unclassified Agarivorans]|uniref:hypothetical protein n=1 Tax=unclassified Agarivorans TaxID=2636026 RepID=UPI0026E38329|nr:MULTISPECIES: hypothetical protein [unclassified Agarivorans]MDO6687830.1 hypothetical protein [Agarivorans sp. 3_MG-2023]MDO6717452.1 hypothetical protein [Agarivorans sp. 2_MG-2023]